MKNLKFLFVLTVISGLFFAAGCKKKDEKKSAVPSPHQSGQIPSAKVKDAEIIVPPEVKNSWKLVKIQIGDKQANTSKVYDVEIGKVLKIPGSDLSVEVLNFLPSFSMGQGTITSSANEAKNPAVQVAISEGKNEPVKIWLFSQYPDIHPFVHPKYDISLVGYEQVKK
ncbi:MAG TPA: DUF2155 domain-containing protein [bacterium]